MALVLDCSLTMSWVFADERTPARMEIRARLNSERAVVPSHWYLEVANTLLQAERRRRLTSDQSAVFLAFLDRLPVEEDTEGPGRAFEHLLPLSRAHGLTVYDAAYLDLALRRSLPLATLDDDLRRAAAATGVQTLGT